MSAIIACEATSIFALMAALGVLYLICKQVDAVDPASSIGRWTTKHPFFFFTTFRSHREHYRQSHLVALYWLLALSAYASSLALQLNHIYPSWFQVLIGVISLGIFVIRFSSPYSEPLFSKG